ncbi:DUF5995 family protein [Paraflavisolibacter sp. H34]|uniref:DUF5995 family protein n=1 Tax=Huijunlia imazamoxiresistens TaxID=3127457 RepID=UPI0030192010
MQKTSSLAAIDKGMAVLISSSKRETVADVVHVMQGLDALLPENDGLKWFNLMYLRTTEAVQAGPADGAWQSKKFLERLTVIFAGYYFSAILDWQKDPKSLSRSWAPLFAVRTRENIFRVQFALAGMNAHINHDLSLALVKTCEEFAIVPMQGSKEHHDFRLVNTILQGIFETVKLFLSTGIIGAMDEGLEMLDDNAALWSITKARDTAFVNAQVLWKLRDLSFLSDAFVRNLDRLVNLSSRGLLIACR